MEDKDIEQLIDKKIADAKLEVAEKQITLVLKLGAALLVILGIALPLVLGFRSADRVDKAIDKMERKFDLLAGKQLREPEMTCYIDGKPLMNAVVSFDPKNYKRLIELKNVGGRTADFITLRLYLNNDDPNLIDDMRGRQWWPLDINDKPEFKVTLKYDETINFLLPQDSVTLEFAMYHVRERVQNIRTTALLKVIYGEPTPLEAPFIIELKKQ